MNELHSLTHEVFFDSTLNSTLQEKGYVIVPFLNQEEIDSLLFFFEAGRNNQEESFATFAINSYEHRKAVNDEIIKIFSRSFKCLFRGYKPFWGNFFIKSPGSSAMPCHADLQFVKEPENISLNIWCPLTDTTTTNGTLGIVPYSHQVINQIRGTNITDAYRKNAKEIETAFGLPLELKAGEAICYDHRLLHYSLPNQTINTRVAATLVAVPEGVALHHYYAEQEGDRAVYKYEINTVEDFLRTAFLGKPLHLTAAEKIADYKPVPVTLSDFEKFALDKN